jgi:hypothetical protein
MKSIIDIIAGAVGDHRAKFGHAPNVIVLSGRDFERAKKLATDAPDVPVRRLFAVGYQIEASPNVKEDEFIALFFQSLDQKQ